MIQKLTNKLTNRKKDNKGFTLVELIVVIVILAILAALLIPALLGWIDKAKEEQYALEARNVYLAVQAQVSEEYAAGTKAADVKDNLNATEIGELADVTNVNISTLDFKSSATGKEAYTIEKLVIDFTSSNGYRVTATLNPNKTWTFSDITAPANP